MCEEGLASSLADAAAQPLRECLAVIQYRDYAAAKHKLEHPAKGEEPAHGAMHDWARRIAFYKGHGYWYGENK